MALSARKGENLTNRPHRLAHILTKPSERADVERGQLEAVAAENLRSVVVQMPSVEVPSSPVRDPQAGSLSAVERAEKYLMEIDDSVAGDHGHNRLFHAACLLWDGFGLSKEDGMPVFERYNQAKAHPPESEYQLSHKYEDAIKKNPVPSLKKLNAPYDPLKRHGVYDPSRDPSIAGNGDGTAPTSDDPPETQQSGPGDSGGGPGYSGDDDDGPGFVIDTPQGTIIKRDDDPHRLARNFVQERYHKEDEGRTLVCHRGQFYKHEVTHYVLANDVRSELNLSVEREFNRINAEKIDEILEKIPKNVKVELEEDAEGQARLHVMHEQHDRGSRGRPPHQRSAGTTHLEIP